MEKEAEGGYREIATKSKLAISSMQLLPGVKLAHNANAPRLVIHLDTH